MKEQKEKQEQYLMENALHHNRNELTTLRQQVQDLAKIAKRTAYLFSNEANYPEGTMGYELRQDALKALAKAEQEATA